MFIETETGRLQNLYLLQDLAIEENENGTFSVIFIQMNGVKIKEGEYATEEEAENILETEKEKLLAE